MKGIMKKIVMVAIILSVCLTELSAMPPTIKAKLDSVQLLMGNITTLHLEVVKDKDAEGKLPLFDSKSEVVKINGDSVELNSNYKTDTVNIGSGRIQINYHIPVQSFDSGFYQLPPFVYVADTDTAISNRLSLKVYPVVVENDIIDGLPDVEEPQGGSIFDKLPDVIVNYWWAFLTGIVVLLIWLWLWKRYRNYGSIIVKKEIVIPPYEEAVMALNKLRETKMWEQGLEKEYYSQLTDIFKNYVQRRFPGINAKEMTSSQLIRALKTNVELKEKLSKVRAMFETADFVKFAKMRAMSDECIRDFGTVENFVESTRPSENQSDDPDKILSDQQLKEIKSEKRSDKKKGDKI